MNVLISKKDTGPLNGRIDVRFRIYDANLNEIWTEFHPNYLFIDGKLRLDLGTKTPLTREILGYDNPVLGIEVEGDEVFLPFASQLYAFISKYAESVVSLNWTDILNVPEDIASGNAFKLRGRVISEIAPASGEVLKWDGSEWIPAADLALEGGLSESTVAGGDVSGTFSTLTNLNFPSINK